MAVSRFTHTPLPIKICFGPGRFGELSQIADSLGVTRALILSTGSSRARKLADRAGEILGVRTIGYFQNCVEHVPLETANQARQCAKDYGADGVICVGGGSTVGHGKAIALEFDVKLIHVITTYSGSEVTIAQGFVDGGRKRHVHDKRMRADCVIYDPELTISLPPEISGPSGMNALAHCVEALYGPHANPLSTLQAQAGIRALATSLPKIVEDPDDMSARGDALFGAYMAGLSLSAGMSLHHQVAHVLGGSFGIRHSIAHTLALPHTIAYNKPAISQANSQLIEALDASDGPSGLFDLATGLGIDMRLNAHGFDPNDAEKVVDVILEEPRPNPRPLERAPLMRMMLDIVAGQRPESHGGQLP